MFQGQQISLDLVSFHLGLDLEGGENVNRPSWLLKIKQSCLTGIKRQLQLRMSVHWYLIETIPMSNHHPIRPDPEVEAGPRGRTWARTTSATQFCKPHIAKHHTGGCIFRKFAVHIIKANPIIFTVLESGFQLEKNPRFFSWNAVVG